jgi:deoxyribodipyrimidine photolyase
MTALMLFHRDLRLVDHNALERIRDKPIIPLFVFTPEQVSTNPLKSTNSVQFMIESLKDLEEQIKISGGKLYCLFGNNDIIIKKGLKTFSIIENSESNTTNQMIEISEGKKLWKFFIILSLLFISIEVILLRVLK